MSSAGANTWSVPLEINNLEAQIAQIGAGAVQSVSVGNANLTLSGTAQNPIISGTLVNLTGNVAGNNRYIAGMYAPPFGTSAIVCAGTDTFLIEDTLNVPLLAVANTGLVLGGGGTATTVPVNAPTVTPSTDSSTKVATTAFVQSVVSSSGNVSSVSGGTNISITGTANVPIINLQAPLTSTLNIGEQTISGASTVGDDTNSISIVAQNGVTTTSALNYNNAVSQQSGNAINAVTNTVASTSTAWVDTPLGTTHSYTNQSSASDNALQVIAIGTVQGLTTTRTDITNILGINDNHGVVDTLSTITSNSTKIINTTTIQENNQFSNSGTGVSNGSSETMTASVIVCNKSINTPAGTANQNQTLQPNSSYFTQTATGNGGTSTASNEQQADATRTRILIKQSDTGGANPILNQNDIYCSPISTYYEQQSKNASGASRTTTLLTSATNGGAVLTTDGTLALSSTGNMTIGSSSGVVLVESLSIQNNSITAVPVNTDLDLTTNGTGAIHITQAVANANGALRITQAVAGGATLPAVKVINTDAGNSSVAVELFKNGSAGVAGDEVARLSIFGKNSGNTKEEYGRITCNIRDPASAPAGADGQLLFAVPVGDAMTTFIDLNGNDNRVKILRALLLTNVPTSSAGLPTGAVWSNAGVLNIVP